MALGDISNRQPSRTNIAFDHIESDAILHHLNRAGIAASLGSACGSCSIEPSHVLHAMGLPEKSLHGAVRLPLSRETTLEEVDQVVSVLSNIVAQLRANSREHANPRKYTSRSRKLTS